MKEKIFVTKPFLPTIEEYIPYLKDIWESGQLTNNGPYHRKLEAELCSYLGVKHISVFGNGTIALMVAIKALNLTGEIITTPYSFVASSHAIAWNNIKPVFVDVDSDDCNINYQEVKRAITDKTSAILPVHVYGNPCNDKEISKIARSRNLKVIYDAAHAFNVKQNSKSILNWGDLSVLSFHSTKVFNTFEGGAIVCHSASMKRRIDDLKNFGFQSEIAVQGIGINGKMNELQAAMGLLQLSHFDIAKNKRKYLAELYRQKLSGITGLRVLNEAEGVDYNYGYFPVFIAEQNFGKSRDQVYYHLQENNIYGRRYFFPLINEYSEYALGAKSAVESCPSAYKISREVICLPLYTELEERDVVRIVDTLQSV